MENRRNAILEGVTVVAGLVVASSAVAVTIALLLGGLSLYPATLVIVSVAAFALGLPIYIMARTGQRDTRAMAATIGFVVGAIIQTFFVLSGTPDEASVDGTPTVVHGAYTLAGWTENLFFISLFGALGLVGGLVFWLIVRRKPTAELDGEHGPKPVKRRAVLWLVIATLCVGSAFLIPVLTADRSCFNPLRNGGSSASEIASFDVHVGTDQWPSVGQEVEAFGRAGNWSIQSDIRPDPQFQWLQVNICKEPGTLITAQGLSDEVHVGIYQPQGGSGWQADFRKLYDRIRARWPSQIAFTDEHGVSIAAPKWTVASSQQQVTPIARK